jgi:hypothetical protein
VWWFSYFFSLSVELVRCCVECLVLEFSKLVLVLVLRFGCRCAAIAPVVLVLVLLVLVLVQILYWCRGGAARWCKEGGAGAEVGGRTEHRCVDVQTEMQRCRDARCTDTVVKRCRGGAARW